MTTPAQSDITVGRVARIALPVVLSNATVPLQGAIDTAVIGNQGSEVLLAAVVLGATAVALLFNLFNFLQMGASGLTAQAHGEGNPRRVVNTLWRALVWAGAIAVLLLAFNGPVAAAVLMVFDGSAEAEALAATYIRLRFLGAPAELATYALIGWFTGQELTRRLFEMQVVTSLVNISLNLVFVLGLGWGVEGVALATVIGAWCGLGIGLWRLRARLAALMPGGGRPDLARVLDPGELRQMVTLNRDIFIRTLCLAAGFAWFARLGSQQGDTVLAANGVLMQFVHVSSYALDGFAIAAEALVGQALGARDRRQLRRAVAVTGVAALGLAAVLAAVFSLSADAIIALFTNVEAVRETARSFALWATLLPLAGVLAYQLDGVFIGAAEGRRMRNAMILAAGFYLPLGALLAHGLGNTGVWLALWLWMGLRAGFLAASFPGIEARTQP